MNSMNYIGKFISNFRDFYNEINTATLTGAIDVVVVEQADGTFNCSPFHVRFGKLGVLRSREKVVDIEINGEPLDLQMKLGESGEAFFVEEVPLDELGDDGYIPSHLACSPIPSETFLSRYHDEAEWRSQNAKDLDALHRPKWPEVDARKPVPCSEGRLTATTRPSLPVPEISLLVSAGADGDSELNGGSNEGPGGNFEDGDVPSGFPGGSGDNNLPTTVKTFRAETMEGKVSEKVRRISIVTGEFRPISLETQEAEEIAESADVTEEKLLPIPSSQVDAWLALDAASREQTAEVATEEVKAPTGGKKKRRKKSLMKKKAGAKKNGVAWNGQAEAAQVAEAEPTLAPVPGSPCVPALLSEVAKEQCVDTVENMFIIDDLEDGLDSADTLKHVPALAIGEDMNAGAGVPILPLTDSSNDEELASMKHANTATNYHFFSDTEVTPGSSPLDSRPNTPIQSDTEAERQRHADEFVGVKGCSEAPQSWRWGELPTPPTPRTSRQVSSSGLVLDNDKIDGEEDPNAAAEAAQRSIISDMFSFMKKTKRMRHNPEAEGIYLADIKTADLDPEVAAIYFPTNYRQGINLQGDSSREEDGESGNGTSLPQSPHSVEGSIGGPKSSDSDFGEPNHSIFPDTAYNEISMSLCGGLNESGPDEEAFLQRLVTYEDLVAEPKIIENPDLVVRLDGKYYNWKTACPMVMSVVVYQRALPQHVVDAVTANYMPHAAPDAPEGAKSVPPRGYTSWFSWPKKTAPKAAAIGDAMAQEGTFGEELRPDAPEKARQDEPLASAGEGEGSEKPPGTAEEGALKLENNIPVQEIEHGDIVVLKPAPTKEAEGSLALPLQTSTDVKEEEAYNGSNSSEDSDVSLENRVSALPRDINFYEHSDMYRKTLRLSSEQIAGLHLVEGANEVVFSVTTAYQGTTRCKCHIYKWRYDDKIVVSDIDGTITKSDVLGHILPIVGKDWAQSGVAQLFTKIQNNGYRLLYLSARAIGQARVTREYLRSIRQGDLSLPDGPLLLNPTSLISAFHREVIEKKPEEFKISCLRDIHALFPADSEPFYAGYGNKVNDVWAYRAVGIPIFRIFTINHRGELKHELTQTFQSSYSNMSYIVDQMFPPPPTVEPSGDFSSFVYWRDPLPELHIELPIKESPSKATLKVPNNKKNSPRKTP